MFPLWNSDAVLEKVERAIDKANAKGVPVILTQHIANSKLGVAPFFNQGTPGADIHAKILTAAPHAPVVVKEFADSFEKTALEETLTKLGATELLDCGMMTQNCVTRAAISKAAEKYVVTILPDCCIAVSEVLHQIALHALSTRVKLVPFADAL